MKIVISGVFTIIGLATLIYGSIKALNMAAVFTSIDFMLVGFTSLITGALFYKS